MQNKEFNKFVNSGMVKDYLEFKKSQKKTTDESKEMINGVDNDNKRGNNC